MPDNQLEGDYALKIDGTGHVGPAGEIPAKKTEKVKGDSFQSQLNKAMTDKTEKTSSTATVFNAAHVAPLGKVGSAINTKIIDQLDLILDDLEIYRNSLGNDDLAEGKLKPMLESLKNKKNDILSLLKLVDDPDLKSIATDASMLIINEDSRFGRR